MALFICLRSKFSLTIKCVQTMEQREKFTAKVNEQQIQIG
jgi:hypothetical protein